MLMARLSLARDSQLSLTAWLLSMDLNLLPLKENGASDPPACPIRQA